MNLKFYQSVFHMLWYEINLLLYCVLLKLQFDDNILVLHRRFDFKNMLIFSSSVLKEEAFLVNHLKN